MEPKVQQLVEWVAWKSYSKVVGGSTLKQFQKLPKLLKESHLLYAKEILSHPDLAFIDREQAKSDFEWGMSPTKGYYPVIPLAKALKENEQNSISQFTP